MGRTSSVENKLPHRISLWDYISTDCVRERRLLDVRDWQPRSSSASSGM